MAFTVGLAISLVSSNSGMAASGCIRMLNADVIDLYDRVNVGTKILV
jgi:lipoprotein-anchoring transpeptidase ErfK/SrfK